MQASPAPEINRSVGRTWLLLAIALSVLLHLAILLIPRGPEQQSSDTVTLDILIEPRLAIRPPETVTATQPEEMLAPEEPEIEPDARLESEPPSSSEDEARQQTEPQRLITQRPESPRAEEGLPESESPRAPLTTRLLANVRKNLGAPEIPEAPDALAPAALPDLPDAPGWIDQYVGTVEARVEQWKNADGTRESRIVTASGQVYCGRARAPTTAELFNPQFAMNIMLFRDCGRVRPPPPDREDPWLRAPDS